MRPRTKIAIIIGILAVIYLLLPFASGIIAQRYVQNFLIQENKTLGNVLGVQLQITQYHRGWFRSTANLEIDRKAENGNLEKIRTIPVVIKHGPAYYLQGRIRTGFALISSATVSVNPDAFYQIAFHENIGFAGEHGAVVFFTRQANQENPINFHAFQANSLVLHMVCNAKANQFLFTIDGDGLHYQNPEKTMSINVQNLNAGLRADYLGERHWDLTLGLGLDKNQLSVILPKTSANAFTLNADHISLLGVHVDTQKMAKVLGDVVILKQATDANQPVKPTAWMALLQEFLTQVIQKDTSASIQGLSITTPMGEIHGHYSVSFPTLADPHDYFDVVTRNVGVLNLSVPAWTYTDTDSNLLFSLKNLLFDETNNTVFLRNSSMQIGEFNINNPNATDAPMMALTGLDYTGELHGDQNALSQIMRWNLDKLCFGSDCFSEVHGKLELLNMNYSAFRGIASATQQVVQYDPKQSESMDEKWMALANAYVKLITPQTKIILSHDMNTSAGIVKIEGELSWPELNLKPTTLTIENFLGDAIYHLNMLFPAAYLDSFLTKQTTTPVPASDVSTSAVKIPTFETQLTQFLQYAIAQGYLKKVGDAYVLDLSGKGSVLTINNIQWKAPQ